MNDLQYYENLSFEELIADPDFRRWIFNPSKGSEKFWIDFYESHPELQEMMDEARAFLLATRVQFQGPIVTTAEVDQKFTEVLRLARQHRQDEQAKIINYSNRRRIARWAVAVSALLLLGFFGWISWFHQADSNIYQTGFGEWKKIQLSDGSLVHLNANSTLTVGDWSDNDSRKVWLEGEAFFDVQEEPELRRKFEVITGEISIVVLGTKFNVQNRGVNTEIFLEEGKIKLDIKDTSEYMDPGQFIAYSHTEQAIVARNTVPQDPYTSWKDGTLRRHVTAEDMLKEITEIYGVDFQVLDTSILSEKRVFAVPLQELETVIPILEISLDRQITKDGNTLIIR